MTTVIDRYAYRESDAIGSGMYGKVYKGITVDTKEPIAIKVVPTSMLKDTYHKGIFNNEINSLRKLNSPYIVKLFDLKQRADKIFLITEFCDGGNLASYLARRKRLNEEEVVNILWQVAQAFKEMSKFHILHRDLKPENLLIHKGLIKVADYGFSKPVKDFKHSITQSYVGSPIYMSPQVLFKQIYTSKADVWSLGIMAYQLLYGTVPWSAVELADLAHQVRNQPIMFRHDIPISPELRDLISRAIRYEERARLSWDEIFMHPAILKSPMNGAQEEKKRSASPTQRPTPTPRAIVTSSPAPQAPAPVAVPQPVPQITHLRSALSPAKTQTNTPPPIELFPLGIVAPKPHPAIAQRRPSTPVTAAVTPVNSFPAPSRMRDASPPAMQPKPNSPTAGSRHASQANRQPQSVAPLSSPKAQTPFTFQSPSPNFIVGQASPRHQHVSQQRPATTTAAGQRQFISNNNFGRFPPQSPPPFGFTSNVPGMRMPGY